MKAPRVWHSFWWLPSFVVIIMGWVGGTMPDEYDPCPAGTDGPQFYCWLQEQEDLDE